MTIIETSRKIVALADERKNLIEYIHETKSAYTFDIFFGKDCKADRKIYPLAEFGMRSSVKSAILQLLETQLELNTRAMNSLGVCYE
jgi:hypothetical protein